MEFCIQNSGFLKCRVKSRGIISMICECIGYFVFALASYRIVNTIVIRIPVHAPVTSVSLAWLDHRTFCDRGSIFISKRLCVATPANDNPFRKVLGHCLFFNCMPCCCCRLHGTNEHMPSRVLINYWRDNIL